MGLTLAKCPACGADLNLEINRDYFFCPHCGSKVLQKDERIIIEHVSRTIDEVKLRKLELEEKKRLEKEAEEKRNSFRLGIFFLLLGIGLIVGGLFAKEWERYTMMPFGAMFALLGAIFTIPSIQRHSKEKDTK